MRNGVQRLVLSASLLVFAGCQGDGTPVEVLPRILEGECVRIALTTRAGDAENLLVIDSLRVRATGEAGCGEIGRVEIGGYMDLDGDGHPGPEEALRASVHKPPGGAADEMTLNGIGIQLPDDDLSTLKLEINVHFTSGRTTLIEVDARE